MVQILIDGRPEFIEPAVIDEPPGALVNRSLDGYLDPETMTMKPLALMPRRHLGQAVRGFKGVFADKSDLHGRELTMSAFCLGGSA